MAGQTTVSDELARAGAAIREARFRVREAIRDASNAAARAAANGMPETQIARALGIDRNTLRAWLGKPRKH
jgi:DNA invertase Pin-like site-specific DNA recombinase